MTVGTASASNFSSPGGKANGVSVSAASLVAWAMVAWVAASAGLAAIVAGFGISGGWPALAGAAAIGAGVSVVGVSPVLFAARTGQAQTIAFGFLAGGILRMAAAFLALLLVTRQFDLPGTPLAIMTMVYYFAGLVAEVVVLKKQLKKSGQAVTTRASTEATHK